MNLISFLWAFLLISATMGISLQFSLKSGHKMHFFALAFKDITKHQLPLKENQQSHQSTGHRLIMHLAP